MQCGDGIILNLVIEPVASFGSNGRCFFDVEILETRVMQEIYYTLPEKLTEIVKKFPDKIVLQIRKPEGYERHTYQDLYNNAQAIAQSLVAWGVQKNDRVAILLENRPEWVFIYFGILFAGAIAVPLDPQSTSDDLKYFLENSESKIIFTSLRFETVVCNAIPAIKALQKIILLDGEKTKKAIEQVLFFSEFFDHPAQSLENIKILPNDIASILYTSGTTGQPKGVMLSHENFYSNFRSIEALKIFGWEHNVLSILPLHHSFPFMVTLLIPLFSQNKVTYIPSIKREEIIKCMQETNVTLFVGVPQFFYLFYQAILNEINNIPFFIRMLLLGIINITYKLRQLIGINLNKLLLSKIHEKFGPCLKYFISGGARLDKNVEIFLDKIGFTLIQGYGLTETAPIVTFNPIKKVKIGSVGRAISDVSVAIIEPDESGVGEVAIRGPNIMRGYYKREQETQEVLKDHWFYSGDLGYLDQEGYLFLTGRKKELIILGTGKNISPEEVETHYLKSRYIKELCVLPVGQGEKEKLTAVIIPDFEYFKTTGEIDINNTIKLELDILSQDYPLYKCIMGFVITKEKFPKTPLGKLKRHEILDKYLDELMGIRPKVYKEEEVVAEDLVILLSPIYQTIATVIAKEKQPEKPVQLSDHLGIDLGFDSLSRIELIATLEKQFNINIPEALIAKIATIKELMLTVDRLITEQKPKVTQIITQAKETLWQDILQIDPTKNITDKIDLLPSWFAKIAYRLVSDCLYIIAKLMWRIKISGTENLPKDQPFILCPNHTSYLDAFLVLVSMPHWLQSRVFFLGYSIFFDVAIIRNLVKIGRIIPLDLTTNLLDTMRACSYVLRHGKTICIFPEGGRSTDGSIQPFKKGIGILARELKIQLVPIYIDGAFRALPRGKFFPSLSQIKIIFGKPCSFDQLKKRGLNLGAKDDYQAIARGIQEEVSNLASSPF